MEEDQRHSSFSTTPGPSYTTGSHLHALWDKAAPDGQLGLQLLVGDICNGVFDGELKQQPIPYLWSRTRCTASSPAFALA